MGEPGPVSSEFRSLEHLMLQEAGKHGTADAGRWGREAPTAGETQQEAVIPIGFPQSWSHSSHALTLLEGVKHLSKHSRDKIFKNKDI